MKQSQLAKHPGFSPFQLHQLSLKNRFVVSPMSRVSATTEGLPTANMKRYYTAFAAGGFSMIITEGLYTDAFYSKAYPQQPGIATGEQTAAWKNITTAVQSEGAFFIAQLMHAGAISQTLSATKAPSAIQPLGKKMPEYGGGEGDYLFPSEMTEADIFFAIEGFVNSAVNAYQAGFNGIEIHAANGYLLDQFLTPYTNQRNDQWGGTVENRFRIITGIIKSIRRKVPAHCIVGLRLSEGKVNNLYYRFREGSSMAKAILNEVQKAKPDYVHIAAESGNWLRDCTYADGSSYTSLARQMAGVPVIANGGLHQLLLAEKVLVDKQADLLAIGTAALADPNWPKKMAEGIAPVPFHRSFIKPSATIEHTWKVQVEIDKTPKIIPGTTTADPRHNYGRSTAEPR